MRLLEKFIGQSLILEKVLFPNGYDIYDDEYFEKIKIISYFKWFFHTGIYVDINIEKSLNQYEFDLDEHEIVNDDCNDRYGSRKVLHIATQLYNTGGHTRLIRSFVERDKDSAHDLLLVEHSASTMPEWINEAIYESGGVIESIVDLSYRDKVRQLRKIAKSGYDVIFLHIHPDDPVPVAALSCNDIPPVVLVNHADHVFWIGVSVADIVVCFRNWSLNFSKNRRGIKQGYLLPIPLSFEGKDKISKSDAKAQLKIDDDVVLIITVASYYKFIPDSVHNYFDLVYKCLQQNENAIVCVIGVGNDDNLDALEYRPHDRLMLLGVVEDPYLYYNAADIFIESMPVNSLTSLYEACYYEACPVLYHNPVEKLNVNDDFVFDGIVSHSMSQDEQLYKIKSLVDDKLLRQQISSECSKRISYYYAGQGWLNSLNELYNKTKSVKRVIEVDQKNINNFIDQNDIDSVLLTQSAFSNDPEYFIHIIYKNLKLFSIYSIVKIFILNMKYRDNQSFFSYLKGYGYLIKCKILKRNHA